MYQSKVWPAKPEELENGELSYVRNVVETVFDSPGDI